MIITSEKFDSWSRWLRLKSIITAAEAQLRCFWTSKSISISSYDALQKRAKKKKNVLHTEVLECLWKYKPSRVSSWDYLQCQITALQHCGSLTAARWAIIWPCCLLYLPSLFFFLIYFFLSSLPPTSCSIFHPGIPFVKKKGKEKKKVLPC